MHSDPKINASKSAESAESTSTRGRASTSKELAKLLSDNRRTIVERWLDRLLKTYSAQAQTLFRNNPDPFANPVGQTFATQIEPLFDQLLSGFDAQKLRSHLDGIVRIRAVQELTASQAVSFVFGLKEVVRQVVGDAADKDELVELESRIDEMALAAFDVYMRCRETIWELRATELKKRTHLLLERVNKKYRNANVDEQ